MAQLDLVALLAALRTAQMQFAENAPLEPVVSDGSSLADTLIAAQPYVTSANAFITAHPGAVRAARTVLGALKAQGFAWAGSADEIVAEVPGLLAKAAADLPMAAGILKEFSPAATGIQGENASDPNPKDR